MKENILANLLLDWMNNIKNKDGMNILFNNIDIFIKENNQKWKKDELIPTSEFNKQILGDNYNSYIRSIPEATAKDCLRCINNYRAAYLWRKYKKIYNFDKDLLQTLFEDKNLKYIFNMKINSEFLRKIPFIGMVMHVSTTNKIVLIDVVYDESVNIYYLVFYASNIDRLIEYKEYSKKKEFRDIWDVHKLPLIDNVSVDDSLDHLFNLYKKSYKKDKKSIFGGDCLEDKNVIEDIKLFIAQSLSMLMYILSINADISQNELTKSTYRKSNIITDKFRDIEMKDVGVHIGNTIRLHKKKYLSKNNKDGYGSSKRPHVRCGHYHSYWIGKHSSKDRKLILKWVQPTFINGYSEKTNGVHINPVTK